MLSILKGFTIFTMIDHFYQKEWKLKNATSLYAVCTIKATMLHNEIKVHKAIQFNRNSWLRSYIEMNTKLRTE